MRLIKKFQFGGTSENTDLTAQTALLGLDSESITAQKIRLDLVNVSRALLGIPSNFITLDNPLYFNYNGRLMIQGSELLKYPLIYTHFGPVNPQDALIDPNLYYALDNNGIIDTTHYTPFTSSDTYKPVNNNFLLYLRVSSRIKNEKAGQILLRKLLGSISPAHNETIQEQIVTPPGFSPGADAAYELYATNPTENNAQNLRAALGTTGAGMRVASMFTTPGMYFMGPWMIDDGYQRIKNAEHWYDYIIGGGEGLLGAAPWLYKGYVMGRSAADPVYSLVRAIDKAPLDVDMLASYHEPFPMLRYFYSWDRYGGPYPFEYQVEHLHGVTPDEVSQLLHKHGYFNGRKNGPFVFLGTIPGGRKVPITRIETQPINYPILVSANPELPRALWGKRPKRDHAERVITLEAAGEPLLSDKVTVAGYIDLNGKVHVQSAYGYTDTPGKGLNRLFVEFLSENPPDKAAGRINAARKYWNNHALIEDNFTPSRDPFSRGPRKSYIKYDMPLTNVVTERTTAPALWERGKAENIKYITSDVHKERLMNNLGLTEELADALVQRELRNLENVELLNLGPHKIGGKYGHTIGYTVEGESMGSDPNLPLFSKIKDSHSVPSSWTLLLYENYIANFPDYADTYRKAEQGITLVGLTEGIRTAKARAAFEEGNHALTRGGIDPITAPITYNNAKWAKPLLGSDPNMVDPTEARVVGVELDNAWMDIQGNLPSYYESLPTNVLREKFFYDVMRASDDGGEQFWNSVPEWYRKKYDPHNNHILNRGTNGLDPDEALFDFWEHFVYNPSYNFLDNFSDNSYSIT